MRDKPATNDPGFDPGLGHLLPPPPGDDRDGRIVVLPGSSPSAVEWTAERIASGGVVAIPTDTVYGIAASLAHEPALRRIFAVKGRPGDKTLPILISSTDVLPRVAEYVADDVMLLLDRYWPGPLTVVVPARSGMPDVVVGPGNTVGVRMPNHPLAIETIAKAGGAIACTSANRSGEPPAQSADEVSATIGDALDLILDGGIAPGGVASTVIAFELSDDVSDGSDEAERENVRIAPPEGIGTLRVLREGAIPSEHLQATWREIRGGA